MNDHPQATERILRLFRWFCHPDFQEEIEGDLLERYQASVEKSSIGSAQRKLLWDVITLFRPALIRPFHPINRPIMLRQNLKISWRSLLKNKAFSIINISGLAMGMCIAILIGLWVKDELQFDRQFKNYDQIARVMQHRTFAGEKDTWQWTMYPLAEELRTNYGHLFQRVSVGTYTEEAMIRMDDDIFRPLGMYIEPAGAEMLTLTMKEGVVRNMGEPNHLLLSEGLAARLFGDGDIVGQTITFEETPLQIAGIYQDFPVGSTFYETDFIGSWELYTQLYSWVNNMDTPWRPNGFQTLVQLADQTDMESAEAAISDLIAEKTAHLTAVAISNPETFLHPMSKWHLASRFENGINTGGRIDNVRLFGGVGIFILLLACINFMNLSTARSEKRSREVGVRKVLGSLRSQLIGQFYSESTLIAFLAFLLALLLALIALPGFNQIADKTIALPWTTPWWWLLSIGFVLLIGIIAGSYPAFYLSSFPIMRAINQKAAMRKRLITPRRVLVILQFTVAVSLIIGVLIVREQIEFGQNRELGFDEEQLVSVPIRSRQVAQHYDLITEQLSELPEVAELGAANTPVSEVGSTTSGVSWRDKDPNNGIDFVELAVDDNYGKTIGWHISEGRDFSAEFASDSSALIINRAAADIIGFEDPIGETIQLGNGPFHIIGVVENIVNESPYLDSRPFIISLREGFLPHIHLKLAGSADLQATLAKVEQVFKDQDPDMAVEFAFIDDEYAQKIQTEVQTGKLVGIFTVLSIFISCLGLFGLVAYMAERRKKEISIRKVLGASLSALWSTLSKEFIILTLIAFTVAIPVAYYFMDGWLAKYTYHTALDWTIFAFAGLLTLLITLVTVSFQTIKAALLNPVNALSSG